MSRVPILIPVPSPPGFPARLDDTLQAQVVLLVPRLGTAPVLGRVCPATSPLRFPSAVFRVSSLGTGDAARPLRRGPQHPQQDGCKLS